MLGEQQAISPNFTSNPTPDPNPNPLPPPTNTSPKSYPHGFDGSETRPEFEVNRAAALQNEMISQTTDSATNENGSGTMNDTTNVTQQQMVNNVILTKPISIIQPFNCEVCNISCDTMIILEKHKLGKKHIKNLQKKGDSSSTVPPFPAVASAISVEDLENKKHKLLQNGASADKLLYCQICNVVCNNHDGFQQHVASKKHSAKAIMQNAGTNVTLGATSECGSQTQDQDLTQDQTQAQDQTQTQVQDQTQTQAQAQIQAHGYNGGSQKNPYPLLMLPRCDLCKISCTNIDNLNLHLSGKKHLKKLQKSEQIPDLSLTPEAAPSLENPEPAEGKTVISQDGNLVRCELCEITCNTYDMLKNHLSGKKHHKNLAKLGQPIGPNPPPAAPTAATSEPEAAVENIGPVLQDSPKGEGKIVISDGGKKKGKRGPGDDDVETKKQKILQTGGTSDALKTCTLCNVVCNGNSVYFSHLAGQKHIAMKMKQAEAQGQCQGQGQTTGQAT